MYINLHVIEASRQASDGVMQHCRCLLVQMKTVVILRSVDCPQQTHHLVQVFVENNTINITTRTASSRVCRSTPIHTDKSDKYELSSLFAHRSAQQSQHFNSANLTDTHLNANGNELSSSLIGAERNVCVKTAQLVS